MHEILAGNKEGIRQIGKADRKKDKELSKTEIEKEKEQAMMTLQGMADHRFTSVSLFTNVFLGEIIFFPLI